MSQSFAESHEDINIDGDSEKSSTSEKPSVRLDSKRAGLEEIILNARGIRYEVLLSHLDKHPKSRLGRLKQLIEKIKKKALKTSL